MAKGQTPAPKAPTSERDNRVNHCLEWLMDGYTRKMALREGSQMWGVCTRTVDDYFSDAQDVLQKHYEAKRSRLLSTYVARLDDMYEKTAHLKEDYSTARQIVMDQAKLAGLLKEQIEVNDLKAPDLSNADPKKIREKLRKS
jgi:hypothetical protein